VPPGPSCFTFRPRTTTLPSQWWQRKPGLSVPSSSSDFWPGWWYWDSGRRPGRPIDSAPFILGFQTLLNLGVVVGVVPVTGLTLPFVSYGGSSLAVTLALAGLLLGVARQTRHEPSLSLTQEVAG